ASMLGWPALPRASPATMKLPRHSYPTIAPRVAVATIWTAEIRSPVNTSGSADGSSTLRSSSPPVMPIPRPASTSSGGVPAMPAYVFVNIGGTPSATSATQVGQKPNPKPYWMLSGKSSAMIANDGMARPMLMTATDMIGSQRRWASRTADGTAIAAAIAVATTEIQT